MRTQGDPSSKSPLSCREFRGTSSGLVTASRIDSQMGLCVETEPLSRHALFDKLPSFQAPLSFGHALGIMQKLP